jgi:hypothetical protein
VISKNDSKIRKSFENKKLGGYISIENNNVEISVVKNDNLERVVMTYTDFAKVVETTFELKEITRMLVQLAGTYDNVLVYES